MKSGSTGYRVIFYRIKSGTQKKSQNRNNRKNQLKNYIEDSFLASQRCKNCKIARYNIQICEEVKEISNKDSYIDSN